MALKRLPGCLMRPAFCTSPLMASRSSLPRMKLRWSLLREEGLVRDLTHYVQDMRKRAGFNIEDHIGLALYTDAELAEILLRYAEVIQAETLADNLLISIEQNDKPSFSEAYRETVSPTSLKKLEGYTV